MNDRLVRDIDARKLDFLEQMFTEVPGKNQKEMMAFMMRMMKKVKEENLTLTSQEMSAAVAAIKKYSTAEELKKINSIMEKNIMGQ
jgi:uncharacterized protein (DUF2267 family)